MARGDVFVSHVEEDSDVALELAIAFEEAGLPTWVYEVDSLPGSSYFAQTRSTVDRAAIVVPIVSSYSGGSQQIVRELVRAKEQRRVLLPVVYGTAADEVFHQFPVIWDIVGHAAAWLVIPSEGLAAVQQQLTAALAALEVERQAPRPDRIRALREALRASRAACVPATADEVLPRGPERTVARPMSPRARIRGSLLREWLRALFGWSGAGDSEPQYDVFISYRREHGHDAARAIRGELRQHGIHAFLDVADLNAGLFDEALLGMIERIPGFIIILTRGCLIRCSDRGDWLRREVVHALRTNRTIVPVAMPGFQWPSLGSLPEDLKELPAHQHILYSPEYFEAMVGKLVRYLRLAPRTT